MQKSEYVLTRTEEEAQRLRDQAHLLESYTHAILTQVGLRAGMSCLDVGCGACDVMKLMGQFVGQTGSISGLDLNSTLGNKAIKTLRSTGLSKFDFIQGDANSIDTIPSNSYDVTFARLFLIHQTDPVHSLRKMWQWTKPGGYMIAMDYDLLTQSTYPPYEPLQGFVHSITEILRRTGKDPSIGPKLPMYFESACGGEPDAAQVWGLLTPLRDVKDYLATTYRSIVPMVIKLGIATQEETELHINGLEQVIDSQPYYLGSLLVAVYKQKR